VKVIVGLGNPGKQYGNTPHNAGFAVLDEIAARLACRLRRSLRFRALTGRGAWAGEDVLLVAPAAYMNLSGPVVAAVLRAKGARPADMVVVMDDADLALGRLRVRPGGSHGGHRGLGSIIEALGTADFARVRVGIGRDADGRPLVEHVLAPLGAGDRRRLAAVIGVAADAALCVVASGADEAMNRFNGFVAED